MANVNMSTFQRDHENNSGMNLHLLDQQLLLPIIAPKQIS